MSLMLGKNISSTCKIRYVRYIALSYEGSHEGMDGIAHCVRARPPFNLSSTRHAARMPARLPWAGGGHSSTLNHSLNVLQTSSKSTLRGPPTRVDDFVSTEFVSFLTMGVVNRAKLASPK